MLSRVGRPHQRSKDSVLRYALEELKFLRSSSDLRIFGQNVAYLMPRAIGRLDEYARTPPSLQIEPTNHCNLNCICCSTSRSSRRRGYMDLALFKGIIDDASHLGVNRVRLFLHGEPLLHPQIVNMINYAKSKDLSLHLTTNGMLLDQEKSEAILRSGINWADHITFSILGDSKEVYQKIMRRADYDIATKSLLDLLRLRRELGVHGPVIETIFHTMPENEHEEENYVRHWRGKVDHARLGGRISESFSEYKRGTQDVRPREKTCSDLWERMTVFWNGDVTLCCQDVDGDWILGSLKDQSITEIWNSEQLLSIKRIHKEKQFQRFPFCSQCDM